MAIQFHPEPGQILICDFDGLREPEMVKRRPVVVVGPRLRNRGNLVTVVPISTTKPKESYPYHCRLTFDPPLPHPYSDPVCWVKADMVYTVGFARLFMPQIGKDATGKRVYDNRRVSDAHLLEIRSCILHGLGLQYLTDHLPGLTL